MSEKKENKGKKESLHPRNPHRGRYDFTALCDAYPDLKIFIRPNPKGDDTIDFTDNKAVICLNSALLAFYYGIKEWSLPDGYLCPPIPGRADYIHYLADILAQNGGGISSKSQKITVLDIGTGASCIYPIIGSQSYGWHFVGTDVDPVSIDSAISIVNRNSSLLDKIQIRKQENKGSMFKGIIKETDRFDLTLCNPPFHSSMAEAQAGNKRKWKNLKKEKLNDGKANLNFGGQESELWCPGGEVLFLDLMARESVDFSKQVGWFSSLVSKDEHIFPLKKRLARLGASQIKVVKMKQGQKVSRFIAWSFQEENISA